MDMLLKEIQQNIKDYYRVKEQNFFYALNELVEIYAKAKKALYMEDSELSFSDVSILVYFILRQIDDSEFLYFRLDAQIKHILLDEFQDTSVLQYEILKPLIDEITSGNGTDENGSFFFVGDVKQSIYRFRGGVSALFDEVAKQQNTEVDKLVVNYRSQKTVVDFVNATFKNRIKNYTPQKVKTHTNSGYVEVIQSDEILKESLERVKTLLSLGANIDDIAILCVTNGDGEVIKEILQNEGIDVVTETTTKLINQKSVKAVIEYLKYIYFKEDIYRYNFFALIGSELNEIKRVDVSKYTLFELVKNVIDEYSLFSYDFHLVRFLSVVSGYQDIEEFLFEYERLDVEAAVSDLSGVRILTIHKSKGLEYENVIVMDRLKKAPPSRDTIIYEYNNIKLKNLYLRTKGRDTLDDDYAKAISKEKSLELEDKLNALYVAFTRAKQNLFVVSKPKDSVFEILDLVCGTMGTLECKSEKNTKVLKNNTKELPYKELYYGTQSDILKLENEQEEDLKSINFGLAMHYMLEMLEKFETHYILHAKTMMLNKYGHLLEDEEIEDIQNRIEMLLNTKEFLKLVSGECYKEKALRYNNNLRYIDLLVKGDGYWNIVDYKSSTNFQSHHIKQVKYYIKAIEEITKQKAYGYLCYLLDDDVKVIEVHR